MEKAVPYLVALEARMAHRSVTMYTIVTARDMDEAWAKIVPLMPTWEDERDFGANVYVVRPQRVVGPFTERLALQVMQESFGDGEGSSRRHQMSQIDRAMQRHRRTTKPSSEASPPQE